MPQTKNTLRIIGGKYRGRRLHFIPCQGLRPTADRVRETVFNWLQGQLADCQILDLFAGSGAMGLEALSRGAAAATFVEQNRIVAQQLQNNLQILPDMTTDSHVYTMTAQTWLQQRPLRVFDLVFLDPPFRHHLLRKTSAKLEQSGCLAEEAWVYVEQAAQEAWPILPDNWSWYREGCAGQAKFALLRRARSG